MARNGLAFGLLMILALSAGAGAQQPATPAAPPQAPPAAQAPAEPDMNKPSADASGAVETRLGARPMLILKGQTTWDEGYETLMNAFKALRAEAARLGLKPSGKPQAMFTETTDQNFRYEAMLGLEQTPDASLKPQGGMVFGTSPEGRAFVFRHVGAYDDIESVYEAITAWLDEKGLQAKGSFVEEYLNEPQGSDDALLELNIYVFVQ
ncbi:MAG: GyrI-like domain-containing protein [Proteobacteria bacterium]|nr:GyrI-like domain-containing protein [Pseudomonadota bacterium]